MKKRMKKDMPWVTTVLIGVAISIVILLATTCGLSSMVLSESLQEGTAAIAVLFTVFLSAFLGDLCAVLMVREQKPLVAGLSSAGFVVVLMLVHFFMFPGGLQNVVGTILAVLGGTLCALLVGNTKKSRGHHHVKKYRFG